MASTILYKFMSGTTFEALPLPGSAARLFDVKKAIVKAKKLDNGSMEFDLAVQNFDTKEEYANESMVLPRGTRLVVSRLPVAARGHGFLARMARNEYAGVPGPGGAGGMQPVVPGSAPSGYYTIDSSARDDEEFVQSGGGEDDELKALQAATSIQSSGPAMTGGYTGGMGRGGGAHRGGHGGGMGGPPKPGHYRPNADPELREQERQQQPKKRATGIPRTFLNLNAPPQTEGNKEGEDSNVPLLQPNTQGFKELVNRSGGQSENISGTRRDLDYALKLTATTVPEHLQCGICNGVVKNAMLLPWDPEGRTACDICIRDALTQNGFRCPLTGMDGASPDELIPNVGLRKATELFIKGVMEKVDEIEKQQVEEAESTVDTTKSTEANVLDGDGVEKGVIVSKKMTLANRKKDADDPFGGGDDDFGGDVFVVDSDKQKDEEVALEEKAEDPQKESSEKKEEKVAEPAKEAEISSEVRDSTVKEELKTAAEPAKELSVSTESRPHDGGSVAPPKEAETPKQHRRERRRRGPPVGYSMGPAGPTGARAVQNDSHAAYRNGRSHSPPSRGGGPRGDFRGRGDRDRERFGGGRSDHDRDGRDRSNGYDDNNRGTKRSYEEHSDGHRDGHRDQKSHSRFDRQDDRYEDRGRSHREHDSRSREGHPSGGGKSRRGHRRGGRGRRNRR